MNRAVEATSTLHIKKIMLMNFTYFENDNLGYHFIEKDISIGNEWIKAGQIVDIKDITVKFWREHYGTLTYRIDIDLILFGGESKSTILYVEIKKELDLECYFNTIFRRISN
jgi:hypothetical protein